MTTADPMPDVAAEQEEPPGSSVTSPAALTRTPRPAIWADVPDEQWDDWRWQLAHRLNSLDELARLINLTPEEIDGLTAEDKFRVDITPYFASLIDPDDPACPVRRQVIPQGRELQAFEGMMEDSLAEDKHSPVPGLVHRYPDRVLMLVTTQCASYCRYCTRSRIVGNPGANSAAPSSTCSSTICAARRRCATCCFPAATPWCWPPRCWRSCSPASARSRTLR